MDVYDLIEDADLWTILEQDGWEQLDFVPMWKESTSHHHYEDDLINSLFGE